MQYRPWNSQQNYLFFYFQLTVINWKIDSWSRLVLTFQRLISPSQNYSGALVFSLFLCVARLFGHSIFQTFLFEIGWAIERKQWGLLCRKFSQNKFGITWICSVDVKWHLAFLLQGFFLVNLCYGIKNKTFLWLLHLGITTSCDITKLGRSVSAWHS